MHTHHAHTMHTPCVQASATIELTTADVNLSRLELPLLTPTGKTLGYAHVSLNAHTAMAPFLAVRRAFEAADTDLVRVS